MNFFTSLKLSTFAHELNHFECVNSITHKLHFALIINFLDEYVKTWHILHLCLNGLMIKLKCKLCIQTARCM